MALCMYGRRHRSRLGGLPEKCTIAVEACPSTRPKRTLHTVCCASPFLALCLFSQQEMTRQIKQENLLAYSSKWLGETKSRKKLKIVEANILFTLLKDQLMHLFQHFYIHIKTPERLLKNVL
jgi:hypothetical protein